MNSKKDVLATWFRLVWTEENVETIRKMFVPENSAGQKAAHGLKKDAGLSPGDFEEFQKALLTLVKEVQITIDSAIEDGDWLVARCTFSARDRREFTPAKVGMQGCVIAKIKDGKILEAHNYFDFLHLFEGLGLLPENTFQKCLSGAQLEVEN